MKEEHEAATLGKKQLQFFVALETAHNAVVKSVSYARHVEP